MTAVDRSLNHVQ